MSFEYRQYRLRKALSRDTAGFIEISADPEVMRYYGEGDGICRNEQEALGQIAWCNEQFARNAGRWIIVETDRDEYIGDIGFFDYQPKHRRAELGYRLMRAYWNNGIITALIGQLIAWGFNEPGYNRIQAMADDRNPASGKVLLKNGFTCEGILREYEFEHGGFVNLEMYSILKRDFSDF
ncbi:MAG: GNAT family N-acetyltransferase [Spirochaetales bacterium]|nr:GNAT family N-acetyltransferase [Spirochaetales bacterium]